jgi:hypothetical protein
MRLDMTIFESIMLIARTEELHQMSIQLAMYLEAETGRHV